MYVTPTEAQRLGLVVRVGPFPLSCKYSKCGISGRRMSFRVKNIPCWSTDVLSICTYYSQYHAILNLVCDIYTYMIYIKGLYAMHGWSDTKRVAISVDVAVKECFQVNETIF